MKICYFFSHILLEGFRGLDIDYLFPPCRMPVCLVCVHACTSVCLTGIEDMYLCGSFHKKSILSTVYQLYLVQNYSFLQYTFVYMLVFVFLCVYLCVV